MRRSLLVIILTFLLLITAGVSPVAAASPPNDDFDDASVISSLPFTDTIDTTEATTAPDDPDCFGQGPTVWYEFTPAEDIRLEANTFGSNYDTTLSAYTGTRGNLDLIACSDDAAGTLESQIRFDALAGVTYYFMVGAYASGPGGELRFSVFEAPSVVPLDIRVTIDKVGTVVARDGIVTLSGTVTCSRPVFVVIFGQLEQRAGRLLIRGFFDASVECDGATRWSATFEGDNGIFKPGKGSVEMVVFADDDHFFFEFIEAAVRLKGARP